MVLVTRSARDIYAPTSAGGAPRGADMSEAQLWGIEVERLLVSTSTSGGAKVYQSLALINSDLTPVANTMAWVVGDATAANNGIYRKNGGAGTGSWVRVADLPYQLIRVGLTGFGTANNLIGTSDLPIPAGDNAAVILFSPLADNTGDVVLAVNGGAALPVFDRNGLPLGAGFLKTGNVEMVVRSGNTYRTFLDVNYVSAVADAELYAQQAADAAALALTYAGEFFGDYNSGHTYAMLDRTRLNGALYMSLQGSNIGNDPDTSPLYWERLFGIEQGMQLDRWRGIPNAANTTVTGASNAMTLGVATPSPTAGTEVCSGNYACKSGYSILDIEAYVNVACAATAYIVLALFRDDTTCIGAIYQKLEANGCFAGSVKSVIPAHPGNTNSHKYSCRLYVTNASYSVGINGSAANPVLSAASRCYIEGVETAI
ncbi:hypothetical protein [Bosea sp. (in: a-proteobacteria)]|jgi:hypothetical protein|uniref:hypothetical protein n=1 Tax=Bosea sp. (in: a-proteobacteria) TaxID=1871050 RepID=UPI003F6E477B